MAKNSTDLIQDGWFLEKNKQWPGICCGLEVTEVLYQGQSDFQDVLFFQSASHGRVMVLDGAIQVTDRDEFVYHEMLSHLPVACAATPIEQVCVIGGGDGGIVRELLKYPDIKNIIWRDIDGDVLKYAEKFLPKMFTNEVKTDSRVDMLAADGIAVVKEAKDNSFDLLIVDSSDPEGPASVLFTQEFYSECERVLKPGGVMVCQGECMFEHSELIKHTSDSLKTAFGPGGGDVAYATFMVPTYPFGQIGIGVARKGACSTPLATPANATPQGILDGLKYYSPEMHGASFVLPAFIRRVIDAEEGPARKKQKV